MTCRASDLFGSRWRSLSVSAKRRLRQRVASRWRSLSKRRERESILQGRGSAKDRIDPQQYIGADTVRERAEKWFSSYQSLIGYEIRDLSITTGETVAFCHYLYRVTGTLRDGGKVEMWVRATVCLQKVEDKWVIVHEHQSVPFNVETGKASLDLKPQDFENRK